MRFVVLLLFVAFGAVALANDEVIEMPVKQHHVPMDILRARQSARLAKLGKSARQLPKFHDKLLEGSFKSDYITSNLLFGTPSQNFTVMLNSGATRAWVLDVNYKQKSTKQTLYDPKKSSTSQALNLKLLETYGSFVVNGTFYTDLMQFGKAKIKTQGFASVDTITEPNDVPFPVDGVLGLTHLTSDVYGQGKEPAAPIDNLMKPLVKKLVTLYLDPDFNGVATGKLTIGGHDKENCDEDSSKTYLSLSQSAYDNRFVVNVESYTYGSHQSTTTGEGYFDTGLSTLALPSNELKAVYNQLEPDYDWDTGLYVVPCSDVDDKQSFSFTFDGGYVYISSEQYIVDIGLSDNNCAVALSVMNPDYGLQEYGLGTPFARSMCTTLDFDNDYFILTNHMN